MAGHSRSKNGVASLAYVPAIHALCLRKKVMDARHEVYTWAGQRPDPSAGHDGGTASFTQTHETHPEIGMTGSKSCEGCAAS